MAGGNGAYRQSCGAPTERCLEIVEAVALRAERRTPIGRDEARAPPCARAIALSSVQVVGDILGYASSIPVRSV
jgi:hypothetical protein